jgi:hypothetical protein
MAEAKQPVRDEQGAPGPNGDSSGQETSEGPVEGEFREV